MDSPPHDRRSKRGAVPKSRSSDAAQMKSGADKKIKRDSEVVAEEDRRCTRRAGPWRCREEAVAGKPMCEHHLAQSKSYQKKRRGGGADSDSGEEDGASRKVNAGKSVNNKRRRRTRSESESDSESEQKAKNRTVKPKVNGKSGDSGNVMKKSKLKEEKPMEKVRNLVHDFVFKWFGNFFFLYLCNKFLHFCRASLTEARGA